MKIFRYMQFVNFKLGTFLSLMMKFCALLICPTPYLVPILVIKLTVTVLLNHT